MYGGDTGAARARRPADRGRRVDRRARPPATQAPTPAAAARAFAAMLAAMMALALGPTLVAAGVEAPPPGCGPLAAAALWMQDTLAGQVATSATLVLMAAVGLAMLARRLDRRASLAAAIGGFTALAAVGWIGLQAGMVR